MSNGLVLDLTQYGDAESRAIAELAAHKNELVPAGRLLNTAARWRNSANI